MSATCIAVVGLQWGDEGKGKIVDWLAADAQHVARFQGGNNAGHTVVSEGRKMVLHLIPSGILQPRVRCYIGPGVVLDCAALEQEIAMLQAEGCDPGGRLTVSPGCALILRHHRELDRARERGCTRIGTTLRGIGPAQEDRTARRAVRLRDVWAGRHADLVHTSVQRANLELEALGCSRLDAAEVADEACTAARTAKPYAGDVAAALIGARQRNDRILLEGSQGALLDIEQGTYPHVTSSTCLASGAAGGLGVDLRPHVVGIAKAYATRVGNGVFPTELDGDDAQLLRAEGEEFGATTGRARRVGWLDVPALRHALAINGCTNMILTKVDVLAGRESVKLCTAYVHGSERSERMVPDSSWLAEGRPAYETHAGWPAVSAKGKLDPAAAAYVERIEHLCEARVDVISVGAEREANIVRRHPLLSAA